MTDSFSPKDPAEIVPLTFDFANLATEPSAPVVSVLLDGETDLTNMLVGSPQVVGSEVRQKVGGGTAGAVYKIRVQVDNIDGTRYVIARLLPVETA
jgi:hypothetical protein